MPITAEDFLMKQDKKLSKLISLFGKSSFALEKRQPFDALTKAVIGQQLSTSAATSITNRVIAIHGKRPFMPEKILAIDTETLRACGIANSKIKTIKGIGYSLEL